MKLSHAWAVVSAFAVYNSVLWAIVFTATDRPIHWASWVLIAAACYAFRCCASTHRRGL